MPYPTLGKRVLLILALLLAPASLRAVDFSFGAAVSSGFSLADGTDLAPGSLILFGTFDISNAQITADANNLSLLNSHFTAFTSATIGEGDPSGFGDESNAGLFNHALNDVDTSASGLNIGGKALYYFVFNAPTSDAATQYGIFSSTTWIIPSGSGVPTDFATLDTDIVDLTTDGDGLNLAPSALILVGSFGPGTNVTGSAFGGGTDFDLAPIPEPAQTATVIAACALSLVFMRRRKTGYQILI